MADEPRRVHPLLFYFPTILATAIAIGLGVYVLVTVIDPGPPDSTYGEFDARYLAKSEYSRQENNAVSSAVCDAREYREDDDTWEIECRFEGEDEREITVWEVTPDGAATRIETRHEEL